MMGWMYARNRQSPLFVYSVVLAKTKTPTLSVCARYQTHQLRNVSDDYCATVQCYRYDDNDDIQWNQFDYVKVGSPMHKDAVAKVS
jgi:hypothetical protein